MTTFNDLPLELINEIWKCADVKTKRNMFQSCNLIRNSLLDKHRINTQKSICMIIMYKLFEIAPYFETIYVIDEMKNKVRNINDSHVWIGCYYEWNRLEYREIINMLPSNAKEKCERLILYQFRYEGTKKKRPRVELVSW
jgi:hypothetical protein